MSLFNNSKNHTSQLTKSSALLIFSATMGLLALFLGKIYYDKKTNPKETMSQYPQEKILLQPDQQEGTSNILAINELTTQLLTERQITEDLHAQNQELIQRLQKTTAEINTSDDKYLTALNTINNTDNSKTSDKETLESTDYYNKVSLGSNEQNDLQTHINQFIENNDNEENIFFESLKVESYIRQNEVRSIVLKRGESIWMLAKRAYGDGFAYKKIMKANPQITEKSARFLKPGTIILVPN